MLQIKIYHARKMEWLKILKFSNSRYKARFNPTEPNSLSIYAIVANFQTLSALLKSQKRNNETERREKMQNATKHEI